MVVGGFSRYRETVDSLPILEKIRLVVAAEFIAESFRPVALPILGVKIVGHADSDAQRGKAFEQAISQSRARDVERELKQRVSRLTFVFNPFIIPRLSSGPTAQMIDWRAFGVGATEPALANVRRGRSAANMNEADRKLNRRVEIFLEPADSPMPAPTNRDR